MLRHLFTHFFRPAWVVANANYPHPCPMDFPTALMGCIFEGGELRFVG